MKRIMYAYVVCLLVSTISGMSGESRVLSNTENDREAAHKSMLEVITPGTVEVGLSNSEKALEFAKGTALGGITLINCGAGLFGGYCLVSIGGGCIANKGASFIEKAACTVLVLIVGTLGWSVPKTAALAYGSFKKAFSNIEKTEQITAI